MESQELSDVIYEEDGMVPSVIAFTQVFACGV